jgi:hypothetical protein
VTYSGQFAQTALRNEKVRVAIDRRHQLGKTAWRVKAEFGADIDVFSVREKGFFTSDGALIALVTYSESEVRQAGGFAYLVDHVLDFSRVAEGLVIAQAPDDVLFDFQIATITALAGIRLEQFKQSEILRSQHGQF